MIAHWSILLLLWLVSCVRGCAIVNQWGGALTATATERGAFVTFALLRDNEGIR